VFQELWTDEYPLLLTLLPTRWIISSFQTFMEHGSNAMQGQIGASFYYFSNLLKAYEAERSLDGLPADSVYPHTRPETPMGFWGMDRFRLGGSDLMLNTLALLLELSAKDPVAGHPAQEFLLRLKSSHTLFSRMDQSRKHHKVDIPQFANCWSFFEDPAGD